MWLPALLSLKLLMYEGYKRPSVCHPGKGVICVEDLGAKRVPGSQGHCLGSWV